MNRIRPGSVHLVVVSLYDVKNTFARLGFIEFLTHKTTNSPTRLTKPMDVFIICVYERERESEEKRNLQQLSV